MGVKTKISWCDATWNPVTGCLHGCEYCYANRIATRFGGIAPDKECHVLEERNHDARGFADPYPWGFAPTLHRYRLDEPTKWKKPKNIFVCSMADLMGAWVPEHWKQDVIAACKDAPQHRYLFLTKNPYGYNVWPTMEHLLEHEFDQQNFWLGCSMTGHEDLSQYNGHYGRYLYAMNSNMIPGMAHRFISIEPILTDVFAIDGYTKGMSALEEVISGRDRFIEWVILGAETGNRKDKVEPERAWIDKIIECCDKGGTPVFMKESLREIMGEDFRQEFPWEVKA